MKIANKNKNSVKIIREYFFKIHETKGRVSKKLWKERVAEFKHK
jgi:hypothetical protein